MIDPPFKPYRDWPLTWTTFTFSDQEAAIDATTEEVFGGVSGDLAVVPGEFVEAVDGGDVITRHPANLPRLVFHLTPFSSLVIAQDCDLFPFNKVQGDRKM